MNKNENPETLDTVGAVQLGLDTINLLARFVVEKDKESTFFMRVKVGSKGWKNISLTEIKAELTQSLEFTEAITNEILEQLYKQESFSKEGDSQGD